MHWKLQCLQSALVNTKGLVLLHDNAQQPRLQKLNRLCYELLSHWPYSPELLPTDYGFFKHLNNFLQGKRFHKPGGGKKCFQRVRQILKHRFLCYRNKHSYCSLAKLVLIVMVPILINNDAFEPSYNDLKFTTLIKPQLRLHQPNVSRLWSFQ